MNILPNVDDNRWQKYWKVSSNPKIYFDQFADTRTKSHNSSYSESPSHTTNILHWESQTCYIIKSSFSYTVLIWFSTNDIIHKLR